MSRQALLFASFAAFALTGTLLAAILLKGNGSEPRVEILAALRSLDLRIDSFEARMAARVAELEEDLLEASMASDFPLEPAREALAPVRREVDGESEDPSADAGPDDPVERILARIDDLDMRIRGLEGDPIERGYSYLGSQNVELRRQGLQALQRVAKFDPQAREAIRGMLADPDARVRTQAINSLAEVGDKDSASLVALHLSDENARVRREAVDALLRLGATESGGEIAQLIQDPDPSVRQRSADALGRMKYSGGKDMLLEALSDSVEDIRGEAIASLGEIGARDAAPVLRNMYETDPGRHRFRLVTALRALGDTAPYQKEVERISRTALSDPSDGARREALRTLTWLARDQSREVLRQAANDPSERVRRDAERMLREVGDGERR